MVDQNFVGVVGVSCLISRKGHFTNKRMLFFKYERSNARRSQRVLGVSFSTGGLGAEAPTNSKDIIRVFEDFLQF